MKVGEKTRMVAIDGVREIRVWLKDDHYVAAEIVDLNWESSILLLLSILRGLALYGRRKSTNRRSIEWLKVQRF